MPYPQDKDINYEKQVWSAVEGHHVHPETVAVLVAFAKDAYKRGVEAGALHAVTELGFEDTVVIVHASGKGVAGVSL